MGCVASAEADEPKQATLLRMTMADRKKAARAKRKGAKSLVHNLVHEEFGR